MIRTPIQTNRFCWVRKTARNPYFLDGFDDKISSESLSFYFSKFETGYYQLIDNTLRISAPFLPLFHFHDEHHEIVTSDFISLLPLLTGKTVVEQGLREFILFNTPLNNHTFYSNVNRIQGISEIRFNERTNLFSFHALSPIEAKSQLNEIFSARVDNFIDNTKNLCHAVFLSGGYESRINAAIAAYYGLKTILITWGHPEDREYIIAKKIAKQLKFEHINIRPDVTNLPYKEYCRKTGFLSNFQYAYRYHAVQTVKEKTAANVLWTGWGDINGFPAPGKPSELFTSSFHARSRGSWSYPQGWNARWLAEGTDVSFPFDIDANHPIPGVMEAKRKTLAPLIFGQVLSAENSILPVFAPWHHPDIYSAIGNVEKIYPKIRDVKYRRVLFKGKLYYSLLKKFRRELNFIPVSKGFYPFWFSPAFGPLAPVLAGMQKGLIRKRNLPFDPVEDRMFLKRELESIINSDILYFDKVQIASLASNSAHWSGPDIMEIFKIIQIYWFKKSLDGE